MPALVTQHTVPVDASAAYRPDALLRVPLQRGPPGNETAWKFRKEGGGAAASPPVYRAARTADCGCNWLLFFFLFHAPQYKKTPDTAPRLTGLPPQGRTYNTSASRQCFLVKPWGGRR